jgi:3'-phosphoadenosine 5'-phosphosulfate sulfotransferase (PAPS reductase)/FAD synthetase
MRQAIGEDALLAFSGGKDAVSAWVALREAGFRVRPVFLVLVPGLQFVEENLAYFERTLGEPILRLPHPMFSAWMRDATFAGPARKRLLQSLDFPRLTFSDCWATARRRLGLRPDAYLALGVRAVDSPGRWINFKRTGAVRETAREWWPIFDWRADDVAAALRRSGVKLSPEYEWFGRSFDGIDARFVEPMAQHAPEDYARLRQWFPLIEAERWLGRFGRGGEQDGQPESGA